MMASRWGDVTGRAELDFNNEDCCSSRHHARFLVKASVLTRLANESCEVEDFGEH